MSSAVLAPVDLEESDVVFVLVGEEGKLNKAME